MAEWLKVLAWKASIPKGIEGSNPSLSSLENSRPFEWSAIFL